MVALAGHIAAMTCMIARANTAVTIQLLLLYMVQRFQQLMYTCATTYLAIGLVLVGFPFWYSLQWRVTVPCAASDC
eukprot:6827-Heterococcus_DN1.PRE.1